MKPILPLLMTVFCAVSLNAQITTPIIRANFGVDGELRANVFNGFTQSSDDWFTQGTVGAGTFIIDTAGVAAFMARYTTDANFRKLPFYRKMRFPSYTVVNNRLLIDGVYTRDYHGDDSTIFASGSNKNGMSPQAWSCPVSQSIPDKNEILEMMVHVRRAGPTTTDSLWMIGGVSIENTTGSRYFDFEMYQTDIYYDRPSRSFFGYGPDAGHTAWRFDAAGNITRPGDIIFTAEYSSATLTLVEARIWIDRASLATTPVSFTWGGLFDGATNSSQYGYASIRPKTAGAFYTGLSSANNTWAGPYGTVLGNNTLQANYVARQFMEFSVNLTKLGLDPVTLLGGNACGMPFRRVLVKSRASTAFTAELKDFVGPFDFFLSQRALAATDFDFYCGSIGVSNLEVTNPEPNSIYTWSTVDGNIFSQSGSTAIANAPGTYVVSQQLQASCPVFATDTIVITFDPSCGLLDKNVINFRGALRQQTADLSWELVQKSGVAGFYIERSSDGNHFAPTGGYIPAKSGSLDYNFTETVPLYGGNYVYYRLRIQAASGEFTYTKIIRLSLGDRSSGFISLTPNPVKNDFQFGFNSDASAKAVWVIYDAAGRQLKSASVQILKGYNQIAVEDLQKWKNGVYLLKLTVGEEEHITKFLRMD